MTPKMHTPLTLANGRTIDLGPLPPAPTPEEVERGRSSRRYFPTPEQAIHSPLCAALAAKGVTEREVIEHLFREAEEWKQKALRLAAFQPIGEVVYGGKKISNPTADKLAAEGHARVMADLFAEERAKGGAEATTLAELAMQVDTRALPPAQWKALRDAAGAVLAGKTGDEKR